MCGAQAHIRFAPRGLAPGTEFFAAETDAINRPIAPTGTERPQPLGILLTWFRPRCCVPFLRKGRADTLHHEQTRVRYGARSISRNATATANVDFPQSCNQKCACKVQSKFL